MNKLENLKNFMYTENYYSDKNYPFLYTDGIKYLAENGRAYWLLDAIASWQKEPVIKGNSDLSQIQFWRLKVNLDNSAVLTCERAGGDIVCKQKIPFTDFPLSKVTLYLCGIIGNIRGVLLLPSEY